MRLDQVPLLVYFILCTLIVVGAVEIGVRLGDAAHRRSEDEKESPVSAITGAILALLAFVLAFTFAIVSDRYDARKALVREEAVTLRTAYQRTAFLPEPDREAARTLLHDYVSSRVEVAESRDVAKVEAAVPEWLQFQDQLWGMAVENARKDMNSDVAALYIESINDITALHAERISVGLQARVPPGIWLMLVALLAIGMLAVGYQTGISGSTRTWAALILAVSFSIVLVLIAALDRPDSDFLPVSQQPLENVKAWMEAGFANF